MVAWLVLILPLVLLIVLSARGTSVMLLAPLMALVAALLATQPLLATMTQVFMPALGGFVTEFFLLFLLGALFGKVMAHSGAAEALAQAVVRRLGAEHAIATTVLACGLLTYGGVSLFVVAFTVYPLARALFAQAGTPDRLIPAAIALGAFTFTMTALPGTPAIQNAIPMPYFGTDLYAAPGLGIIAAIIMAGGGLMILNFIGRREAVEGTGENDSTVREDAPPAWQALLPIVLVLALNLLLSRAIFPAMDFSFLQEEQWGGVDPSTLTGLWAVLTSLAGAILLSLALFRRQISEPMAALGQGAQDSLMPLMNTASLVGFGAVMAALPAFDVIRRAIEDMPGGAAESLAVAASVLAGITGSASGGMSIALDALGADYLQRAQAEGLDPALLHRVTALATGGLDALPHNGAVITLLTIGGLTHRQAYGPVFLVAVAVPVLALVVVLGLARVFGTF